MLLDEVQELLAREFLVDSPGMFHWICLVLAYFIIKCDLSFYFFMCFKACNQIHCESWKKPNFDIVLLFPSLNFKFCYQSLVKFSENWNYSLHLTVAVACEVIGCAGESDRGKRPLMTKIATGKSEVTMLTSDNPKTEDPCE